MGLSATNSDGCLVTDTIEIIYKELPVIIPNPQFIGKGNTFTILNLPTGSSVYLYDALGQQLLAAHRHQLRQTIRGAVNATRQLHLTRCSVASVRYPRSAERVLTAATAARATELSERADQSTDRP